MNTIYLTHSIFHVIYSLSIIKNKADNGIKYLVLAGKNNSNTIDIVKKIMSTQEKWMENIKVINIPKLVDKSEVLPQETINVIGFIKSLEIEELVTFNEDNLLAIHLGHYFSRKNTKVSLAQDGTKTYVTYKALTPRYSLLRSLEYYRYCKKNNFEYNFHYIQMQYGKSKYLSKLYVTNRNAFENKYNKECEEIKLGVDVVNLYAITLDKVELDVNIKTIFFVSSLLKWNQAQVDVEYRILKKLQDKYSGYQLVIKTHPRASQQVLNFYKENLQWIVISDSIPAEAYIVELKNSVMLSAYSSAAIFEGNKESFYNRYWLYPIYGMSLPVFRHFRLKNPDRSIKIVERMEDFLNIDLFQQT